MRGMAHGAALRDDRPHLRERDRRARRACLVLLRPDQDGDERDPHRRGDRDPPCVATGVPQVEEVAHPRADHHQRNEDQPRMRMAVRERKVVADHREQHRQRQVVVVHRALLAAEAGRRVRLATGLLRTHELPVRGDDHEEDVAGHHRPHHRADLDVRAASAEQVARAPRAQRDEREQCGCEQQLVPAEHPAQDVVDHPRGGKQGDADRDRLPLGQVGDALVDQVRVRVDVVEDDEQREAAEPGRVRLPLEPEELLGELRRRDPVLVDAVEAAAVDLPRLAADAFVRVARIPRRS